MMASLITQQKQATVYVEGRIRGSGENWVSRWQMLTGSNLKGIQKYRPEFMKTLKVGEKQRKKNAKCV